MDCLLNPVLENTNTRAELGVKRTAVVMLNIATGVKWASSTNEIPDLCPLSFRTVNGVVVKLCV